MNSSNRSPSSPPRVFISYSHDNHEHCERVLSLAQHLRSDGIDARVDQFETSPSEGWPLWCARQILDADYVLLVCTEQYRQRFLGLDQFGRGRGVKWEGKIIQNILYYEEVNPGFIPVIFTPDDERHIPETVKEASWHQIQSISVDDSDYSTLRRRLTSGRELAPLEPGATSEAFRWSEDASIPTQEVWEASERILIKLDKIQREQEEHEQKSAKRHRVILGGLLSLTLFVVLWGVYLWYSTRTIVTDPAVLRSKLEQKIGDTFEQKLAWAKSQNSPYQEIDQLYRWRERALARLDEVVRFIQSAAQEVQSSLSGKAAGILQERGVDAALEYLQKSLADEGKRHKAQARELAEASLFKAELHDARFEFDQARQSIQDAIQFDFTWWKPHNRSGLLELKLAHWEAAEKAFKEAERFVGEPTDRAPVLNNLAGLLLQTGRHSEAEPLLRGALEITQQALGSDHSDVAMCLNNLGGLLMETGRYSEAEPLFRRALGINEQNFEANQTQVAMNLSNLGSLLFKTNRFSEAEPLFRRALEIDERSLGPHHPQVAILHNNLAQVLDATTRFSEAEPHMRRALEINEQNFGKDHPGVATILNNLALLLKATNRFLEAEPLFRRALEIDERSLGPHHPQVAIPLYNLTHLLRDTDRLPETEPLMRRALIICLEFTLKTGHLHPHLAMFFVHYRNLLLEMSIPEDQIWQRIAEIGKEANFDDDAFDEILKRVFSKKAVISH